MHKTTKTNTVKKKNEENDKGDKKVGRPTQYTTELGKKICDKISETNQGLSYLCAQNTDFPCRQTIHEWVIDNAGGEFADMYRRARELQAELIVDELLNIADNKALDLKFDVKTGEMIPDNEVLQRSRLRVDTRKWLAAKFYPKLYGEKVVNEHQGKDGGPIQGTTSVVILPHNGRD